MTRFPGPLPALTLTAALSAALALTTAPAVAAPAVDLSADSVRVTALSGGGTFEDGAEPYAYDRELAPPGASAQATTVSINATGHGTATVLRVSGLVPKRSYGAHLHTRPCGPTGAAAGPHYQHVQDPVTPSVDPAYANARNEVWLDFTTDSRGDGVARSRNPWAFTSRVARSLVIHAEPTSTHAGHAGTAGARVTCTDLT